MKFIVILERGGRWVWELRSKNGEPLCRSVMSFGDREQTFKAIQTVRSLAPQALVFDPIGSLYEGV
ncbi:MAG: DUF1508 domain-containing protein [Alcaligenaceae bacterium]|nr:MAG: DUF1508 domain-containing protein [Alcaligenaceae bacterium]